jgi:serine protease inhibitor
MTPKEKAINWVNNYFKVEEESLYRDLEVEVKRKHVDSIVYLSEKLHNLKERKADLIEQVEDSEDNVDLIHVISYWSDANREIELNYLSYVFGI